MKQKEIEAIVYGVDGYPVLKKIHDDLDVFHRELNCDTFAAYSNTELGQKYGLDIYLDDNGKLYGQDTITGIFVRDGKVIDFIVGPMLICRHDEEGYSASATPDDMLHIAERMIPSEYLHLPDYFKFKKCENLLLLLC